MIARVVKKLQRPVLWFLLQTTRDENWQRYKCDVPLHVYGAGSRKKFCWYLEGELDTDCMEIGEMTHWLLNCDYVTDDELFNERDVWQHPITFERIRKGDCEDYSLWVWRKLIDRGYEVEFVAGWAIEPGEVYAGHTWIIYHEQGVKYLLDPVATDRGRMIRRLSDVSDWYVPQVSIDQNLVQYVYGGYYRQLRQDWEL